LGRGALSAQRRTGARARRVSARRGSGDLGGVSEPRVRAAEDARVHRIPRGAFRRSAVLGRRTERRGSLKGSPLAAPAASRLALGVHIGVRVVLRLLLIVAAAAAVGIPQSPFDVAMRLLADTPRIVLVL